MTQETTTTPSKGCDTAVRHEDLFQVILHNDDHTHADYVVRSLQRIFGHSLDLALKIMIEAHRRGRAIAEVESESPARTHRDQLQSCGLLSTIEKI